MKIQQISSLLFLSMALLFTTGCASTANQSSTGEYIDDTVITARVKTAIFSDPDLNVAEINVETFKSVVQLSGFVANSDDIARAGSLAAAVAGVTSVRNDIIIK